MQSVKPKITTHLPRELNSKSLDNSEKMIKFYQNEISKLQDKLNNKSSLDMCL